MTPPESTPQNFFDDEKKKTLKAIQRKLASFTKAIQNATAQLKRSKEFEQAQHLAELVKANFGRLKRGMKEITVEDWSKDYAKVTIPLDPKASPQKLIQDMFRKSQKLKKAVSPLEMLLKKLDSEFRHWQSALSKAEEVEEIDALKAIQKDLNLFVEARAAAEKAKRAPYHLYHSASGLEIFVGKNSTSND